MTVWDAKPGDIVEIFDRKFGKLVASGRLYVIVKNRQKESVQAREYYSKRLVGLYPRLECRIVKV